MGRSIPYSRSRPYIPLTGDGVGHTYKALVASYDSCLLSPLFMLFLQLN